MDMQSIRYTEIPSTNRTASNDTRSVFSIHPHLSENILFFSCNRPRFNTQYLIFNLMQAHMQNRKQQSPRVRNYIADLSRCNLHASFNENFSNSVYRVRNDAKINAELKRIPTIWKDWPESRKRVGLINLPGLDLISRVKGYDHNHVYHINTCDRTPLMRNVQRATANCCLSVYYPHYTISSGNVTYASQWGTQ